MKRIAVVVALLLSVAATAFALDPPAKNMVGWQDWNSSGALTHRRQGTDPLVVS